ncbi:Transcription factorfungi [Penicillium lividum]|nr:Transcription factorfungi [Penicillium lividum]
MRSQYPLASPLQSNSSPGQTSLPGLEWSSRTTVSTPAQKSDRFSPWEGIQIGTTRSPNSSWYGSSSLFHFIGRMNSYLGAILQQTQMSNQMVLHGTASTLLNGATEHSPEDDSQEDALSSGDLFTAGHFLSPIQEEYFLDFFWKSYHTCLFPIINEAEFMDHYRALWAESGDKRRPDALADIVIALCMQHGVSHLSPDQQKSIIGGDPSVAGRWYFRRCQQLVTYQLESPTVSTVQSLMLCSIYLCNGSFQNMSATWAGMAATAAYVAGLHIAPSHDLEEPERELRKRLWWGLYELDAKIGMKLGRPFLLHRSPTEPDLPDDQPETAKQSGSRLANPGENKTWLSFHLENTKLFIITREIHESFYARDVNVLQGQSIWDDPQALESHAEFLHICAKPLDQWVVELPNTLKTSRQENGIPFSTDGTKLDIEPFAPIWLQRQRLILELIYHNLCINMHRPFISFVPGPHSSLTERFATKCALHAMEITKITHQTLSSTKILTGWHEAFQWQWNASMTLVGFILAHPRNTLTPEAIKAVDLAITVCEIFGERFSVANSAATILRNLGPKINILLQYHSEMQGPNTGVGQGILKPTTSTEWLDSLMAETSSSDPSLVMPMQDMFQMAFSIEQWSALDNLLPDIGDNWNPQSLGVF